MRGTFEFCGSISTKLSRAILFGSLATNLVFIGPIHAEDALSTFLELPEGLDFLVFRSGDQQDSYVYVPHSARFAVDDGDVKFGLQYFGLDDGDGTETAALTTTISLTPTAESQEALATFIRSELNGSAQPLQVKVKPKIIFENSSGQIEFQDLEDFNVAGGDGHVFPTGGELAISADLTFLGASSELYRYLSGERFLGFVIEYKFQLDVTSKFTSEAIEIKLSSIEGSISYDQLIREVSNEFNSSGLTNPKELASFINGLTRALPPLTATLDKDTGAVRYTWDAEIIKNVVGSIGSEGADVFSSATVDVQSGFAMPFGDVCSAFEEQIIDLETFETGCEGLKE